MIEWNRRYNQSEYVYGTEPNEFLAASAHHIPPGRVLSIGEGEGRNATFLAEKGYDVVAVDASDVGLMKAKKLAGARGLSISTVTADLADFTIEPVSWEGIVSIFCHLSSDVRKRLYPSIVAGLKPGGVFILEAYTPRQLEHDTGGPKSIDLLLSLEDAVADLRGLHFLCCVEKERSVNEGLFHTGPAHVLQLIGVKK
jgi:SAM-dependent methyltransferase